MQRTRLPGFSRVDHVGLTVADLDKAVAFYTEVLGATELCRLGPFDSADAPQMPDGRDWSEAHINVRGARLRIAMLQLTPNLRLELMRYELPEDARTTPPRNCDLGAHHLSLQVEDLEAAAAYLRSRDVRVMEGPIVVTSGHLAGMKLCYFLDPWGNNLELVEYPPQP